MKKTIKRAPVIIGLALVIAAISIYIFAHLLMALIHGYIQ